MDWITDQIAISGSGHGLVRRDPGHVYGGIRLDHDLRLQTKTLTTYHVHSGGPKTGRGRPISARRKS